MIIRRFNQTGLNEFAKFLDSQSSDDPLPWSRELLDDEKYSEPVQPQTQIENREFHTRMEAAEYFNQLLGDLNVPELERDVGLWSWLSYFYFDQLCPPRADGERKPGARARWIPATDDFRRYYRHLLAGPYRIYRAHRDRPERARSLLATPLDKPGDIVEQLASRQDLVTSNAAVEVATHLYISPNTCEPKRGAAGRGPGSARRLAQVLNQFDLTWDIFALDLGSMLHLLPNEFDKFRR